MRVTESFGRPGFSALLSSPVESKYVGRFVVTRGTRWTAREERGGARRTGTMPRPRRPW